MKKASNPHTGATQVKMRCIEQFMKEINILLPPYIK
jgi:hypothetical protein